MQNGQIEDSQHLIRISFRGHPQPPTLTIVAEILAILMKGTGLDHLEATWLADLKPWKVKHGR